MAEDEIKQAPETEEHFALPPLEDILKDLEEKLQNPEPQIKTAPMAEDAQQSTGEPEQAAAEEATNEPAEQAHSKPPVRSRRKKRKEAEENISWQESLLMSLHDVVYLMAALMIVFILLFRIVVVDGSSMYSTLWHGDYLLVMSSVISGEPEYGDIVVASKDSFNDGEPIIKRIIATEGQTVDIDFDAGIVYVDGVALEEDYTYTLTTLSEGVAFPLTVSEGCVFAMGDNRDRSRDSRYPDIGLIDEREILGKAVFLFYPGTGDGSNEAPRDFSRIGVLN